MKERYCEVCSTRFKVPSREIKRGRGRFCSRSCAAKNRCAHGPTPKERFWKYVHKSDNNQCWLWTGSKNIHGYGQLKVLGKSTLAHRYSYVLHNGPIPEGLQVHHQCDRRECCNPNHLWLGTQLQNMLDMEAKNRGNHPKGSANGVAKLVETDIPVIRERLRDGLSQRVIAQEFGVSQTVISDIALKRIWRHV